MRFKESFLDNREYFAMIIAVSLVFLGSWGLYDNFYNDSEDRNYRFSFEDRPEFLIVELSAPQGFNEGNTVNFTNFGYINNGLKNSSIEKFRVDLLDRDIVITGTEGENLKSIAIEGNQWGDGPKTFTLEKSDRLQVVFEYGDENNLSRSYSERKKIQVEDRDDPRFLLGIVALLGLAFSSISGVKSFSEMLE